MNRHPETVKIVIEKVGFAACPKCGKNNFTSPEHYYFHVFNCQKTKDYDCFICQRTFANNRNLIRHLKGVHLKKAFEFVPNCSNEGRTN